MSPHGMHHDAAAAFAVALHLPTHVSARNASPHKDAQRVSYGSPNSCLRTECIGALHCQTVQGAAPNSCLRTECIPAETMRRSAPAAPNSCLRTECITDKRNNERAGKTPNSCLRTECIFISLSILLTGITPNSCLRTECIVQQQQESIDGMNSQLMSPHGMHPGSFAALVL